VPWQPPMNPETEELNKKIAELQLKIKSSEEESKRIQKQKEQEEDAKKKTQELKALVEKELEARRMADQKAKEAEAAKKREVAEEARKLLEQQEAKAKQEKQKAEEENAKIEAAVNARLGVDDKMKLDLRKPTHTKFSKIHLCKEALDEKGISYTESEDSFLVHRWVDRDEQNALWTRTKKIREWQLEYQRQFKAEADKAPVIDTPNGPVKIVKVGGYPPVTVPVVLVTKKAQVYKK